MERLPGSPAPLDTGRTPTRPREPHTPAGGPSTPCNSCGGDDSDRCCVCFSPMISPAMGADMSARKKRYTTHCGHSFHTSCITAVRGHRKISGCPLCRAPLNTGLTPVQAHTTVSGHILATGGLGAIDSVFFVDNIVNRARTARMAVVNSMAARSRQQQQQPPSSLLGRPGRRRTLDMQSSPMAPSGGGGGFA